MGIKGLFQALNKLGAYDIKAKPILPSLLQVNGHIIYVDVLGSLYSSLYKWGFRDLEKWAYWVKHLFGKLPRKQVVFLVDGRKNIQKEAIHRDRNAVLNNNLTNLQNYVNSLQRLTTLKRHHHTKYKDLLKRAFGLSFEDKTKITEALINAGLKAFQTTGEADVALGQAPNPIIAVSHDSDCLAYDSVSQLWKPIIKNNALFFKVLDRSAILSKLNLTTEQFKALAIISANDYNIPVKGYGFIKNFKFIR